jgi:WD40 repeat protein
MNWPGLSDYNEAVQSHLNFADPDLREARLVLAEGQCIPLPFSGRFAAVYELRSSQCRWAVKCFYQKPDDLEARYEAISRHLGALRLPFLVDFQYLERGIRIGQEWFPVVKMPWVEGKHLDVFVRETARQPVVLQGLAQVWLRLARSLRQSALAHGDLQHGNVLMVPGRKAGALAVKLVDYDGLFVPELADHPPQEVGHDSYQHPQRQVRGGYNLDIDAFSLLVVAVALRALAVDGPGLLAAFDGQGLLDDRLLFSRADLVSPAESLLFQRLWHHNDAGLRSAAGRLALAAVGPIEQVPLLEDVFAEGRPLLLEGDQWHQAVALLGLSGVTIPVSLPPVFHRTIPDPEVSAPPGAAGVPDISTRPTVLDPLDAILRELLDPTPIAGPGSPDPAPTTEPALSSLPTWLIPEGAAPSVPVPEPAGPTEDIANPALAFLSRVPRTAGATSPSRPPFPHWRWPATAAVLCLVLGGLVLVLGSSGPAPSPPNPGTAVKPSPPIPPPVVPQKPPEEPPARFLDRLHAHPGGALCVATTPDGLRVATGGVDGTIALWELETGKLLHRLSGHTSEVLCLAFGPDGRHLLSGGSDRTARFWDTQTGKQVRELSGHTFAVTALAVSGDGQFALTAGDRERVRLWDLSTGAVVRTLDHPARVVGVAFSPDGKRVLTGLAAGPNRPGNHACLWDAGTGKLLRKLAGHSHYVQGVCFTPDGKQCVTASFDRTLKIWDADTGEDLRTLNGHGWFVRQVVLGRVGRQALSNDGREVILWNLDSGEVIERRTFTGAPVEGVVLVPDETRMLVVTGRGGGGDLVVRVLAAAPPSAPVLPPDSRTFCEGHGDEVRRAAWATNGERVLTACLDETVRLFDADGNLKHRMVPSVRGPIFDVAFSPASNLGVSVGDRSASVWDLASGLEARQLAGPHEPLRRVTILGDLVAACGPHRDVYLWDLKTGNRLRTIRNPGPVESVALGKAGEYLYCGLANGTIAVWRADNGRGLPPFLGHIGAVQALQVTADGRYLFSAGADRTVRVWVVRSRKGVRRLAGHTAEVLGLALSVEGRRVLSCGADRTVRLWDVDRGELVRVYKGHAAAVWDVGFMPGGEEATSASADGTVRAWRLPAFAPDGPLTLAPAEDEAAGLLPIPDPAVHARALKEIRGEFARDYAKKDLLARRALAETLLRRGQEEDLPGPLRDALLAESRRLAAESLAFEVGLSAAAETARHFAVSRADLEAEVMELAARSPAAAGNQRALAESALELAERAIREDAYEAAARVVKVGLHAARRSDDALSRRGAALEERIERLSKAYEGVQPLFRIPNWQDDPDAHHAVGWFHAFVKKDWPRGLRHLAKGKPSSLQALAVRDQSSPTGAEEQHALGDAWKRESELVTGDERRVMRERACFWYRQALASGGLGLDTKRVEKKLRELEEELGGS